MADSASIWRGQQQLIPVANSFGNVFEEWQIATAGQTVFVISSFQYTPGTNTLLVFRNGIFQQVGTAYVETNSTTVTWLTPVTLGDRIAFFAFATSGVAIPNGGGVPAGGAAGQVLTKVNGSDYNTAWTSISAIASLLDAPITTVASANTVDLSALTTVTRNIVISGTTNIAGFQIARGQLFAVRFSGTLTLVNSASLVTQRGTNLAIFPGDTCFIRAISDNVVEILSYTGSGVLTAANNYTFRNKLINGAIRVDQESLGTVSLSGDYMCDMWYLAFATPGTISGSAIYGSGFAPGFASRLRITSSAATVPAAGSFWQIRQQIEGNILEDLQWGTAGAKTIAVSFWVRSSVPGTYSVSIQNSGASRGYVAPFTINAANTAEFKTLIIPGDTTGTWLVDSNAGIIFSFCVGIGTTFAVAGNAWTPGGGAGLTGQTNLVATSGATMDISGVQLEVGTNATAFEVRPYEVELFLCRRYFYQKTGNTFYSIGQCTSTTTAIFTANHPAQMRIPPNIFANGITVSLANGTFSAASAFGTGLNTGDNSTMNVTMGAGVLVAGNATILSGGGASYLKFISRIP